ncbi:MAG: BrnT family toxin [Terriglobales bacterium]
MEFVWDERKNRANRRKHGVSFETAILVFDDPYHLSTQDREVEGEPRWQTIGVVHGIHVLLVAHTVTGESGEEMVRILSARKATRRERSRYAEG